MNALQIQKATGSGTLVRALADLFLDYLRWTQFVPMLVTWGVVVLMVVAMTVVSLQEQGADPLGTALGWVMQLPWVGDRLAQSAGPDGTIHLSGGDFKSFLLSAWGALSLAGMLLGMVWGTVFGAGKPWSLKRKLGLALLGCILLVGGMLANLFAHREIFAGSTGSWILNFSGIALIVFIVSLWSLTVTHVIDRVRGSIAGASAGPAPVASD